MYFLLLLLLFGVGLVSFIGCLIWLIVRIIKGNAKIPPIIGMLLSLVMLVVVLAFVPETEEDSVANGVNDISSNQEEPKDTAPENTSDSDGASSDSQGIWYVDYYKDEFKQATDKWYITAPAFSGTFCNAIVTDESLAVEVLVDCEGEIAFLLYEYGDILKTTLYTFRDEMYNITMRTSDGVDYKMTGTMYSSNNHLCIDEEYKSTVLETMLNGETVSFYIEKDQYHIENYLFSIVSNGFSSVYQSQIGG